MSGARAISGVPATRRFDAHCIARGPGAQGARREPAHHCLAITAHAYARAFDHLTPLTVGQAGRGASCGPRIDTQSGLVRGRVDVEFKACAVVWSVGDVPARAVHGENAVIVNRSWV